MKISLPVVASLALRSTIAAAFAYGVAHPDLPQLHEPATRARMLAWPIGLLAVPFILRAASRRGAYPWTVDALLALPFALDACGNVLDLYNAWPGYDTMNHGISWFGLTLLVSRLRVLDGLPAWGRAWIVLGSGALAAILWELGEYAAFIHSSHFTRSAYTDTLTDLLAGSTGAVAAAALVLVVAYRPLGRLAGAALASR